ncbi:hypothetical protein WAI453_002290 [Rhynchosporium graminicola]
MARPIPPDKKRSSNDFPYVWVCCKCDKFNGTDKYFRNNELCADCRHESCAQCIDTEPEKPIFIACNWICCNCFELKDVKIDSRKECGKCKHDECEGCFDAN